MHGVILDKYSGGKLTLHDYNESHKHKQAVQDRTKQNINETYRHKAVDVDESDTNAIAVIYASSRRTRCKTKDRIKAKYVQFYSSKRLD